MSQTRLAGLLTCDPQHAPTPSARIPLTGVQVRARIAGTAARVRLGQSYENREKNPIEAVYVFPLEEGSAVCGFAVTIDGKRLEGRVKEREAAFDEYDDAMAVGHGAFLLDQERPNVFTASVGNLLPGQRVEVEIEYLAELVAEGPAVRFTLPTTVSPRYVPESHRDHDGQVDGDRVNPPTTVDDLPYRLDLRVDADLLCAVRSVESPSHKLRTEIDGTRVRISLAGDEGRLDRDLVLLLTPADPARPVSVLAPGKDGERFVLAAFRPEIPQDRSPVEALFLVDCSGSMGGPSIADARRTLRLCLHSLQPGDRFDVVRFGSSHRSLFGESRAYDDATLREADESAERMQADLGGTEILSPLSDLLNRKAEPELQRRVVLLTDGQVSNDADVIALAREHRNTTQIYAFGLGAGASEHLVRGVARASRGAAEFIYPGERIEDKVMRQFRRLGLPSASGVRLEWEGLEVEDTTPAEVPPLFPGEMLTVLARVREGRGGLVRLVGEVAGRGLQIESEIETLDADAPSAASSADVLPLLWARRRIRELEEGDGSSSRRGSRQNDRVGRKRTREQEQTKQELVRLGTRYGLMSSATSYVVIEVRSEEERSDQRAELRKIPVALTRGWGGWFGHGVRALGLRAAPTCAPQAVFDGYFEGISESDSATTLSALEVDSTPGLQKLRADRRFLKAMLGPDRASSDSRAEAASPELAVLLSQNADGSWDLTPQLALQCGARLSKLKRIAKKSGRPDGDKLLATLLALHLAESADEVSDAWKPVLEKGERWLAGALGDTPPPAGHATWKDWATGAL